jgi:hypothetical protein
MNAPNSSLSPQSQSTLKYVAHVGVLGLWLVAGGVFTLQQMFAQHGLGTSVNYWLWFIGYVAVSSAPLRLFRSALPVLGLHAGLAMVLNLLPTTMPFAMLRAGYDLLLTRS